MDKKFSLLLNSRKRPQLLFDMINNIVEKTSNLDDIEVLVNFDSDDIWSLRFIADLSSIEHPINKILKFEFRFRDHQLTKSYNRLASFSSGEFLFVMNDDARIETDNWDALSYPILKEFGPISYGRTSCNSVDHHPTLKYASFPIISRQGYECLGFFLPEELPTLGGDVLIYRIYEDANKVVDIPINLRHITHETLELVFTPDETAAEFRAASNEQYAFTSDITKYVEKIKNV